MSYVIQNCFKYSIWGLSPEATSRNFRWSVSYIQIENEKFITYNNKVMKSNFYNVLHSEMYIKTQLKTHITPNPLSHHKE